MANVASNFINASLWDDVVFGMILLGQRSIKYKSWSLEQYVRFSQLGSGVIDWVAGRICIESFFLMLLSSVWLWVIVRKRAAVIN